MLAAPMSMSDSPAPGPSPAPEASRPEDSAPASATAASPPPQPAPPPASPPPSAAAPSPSALAPLRAPVFRMLWSAWLAANLTMWMNDVAAAWLMTTLTSSVAMVALVQVASTLPVFVLGLPSGAMADIVDRRRFLAGTQLWVATVAVVLYLLSVSGWLDAHTLLLLTFANGIGMALRWPVFAAIVPDVVPRADLPAALALNGVAMNMSRVIGPIVAGALLAGAGAEYVFLLNAVLALVAFVLVLRWQAPQRVSALPGERFFGAMRVGLQHVTQSPRLRAVLLRVFLFFLQSSAVLALLPLVARELGGGGGGAGTYTLLLSSMGAGAIVAALSMSRLRSRFAGDQLVLGGTLVQAAMALVIAHSPYVALTLPAMVVSGMAWIATANSLTVAAQLALPNWVRARGMAMYQMALMGGSAAGAGLWGYVAQQTSVRAGISAAALFGLGVWLTTRRVRVIAEPEDFSPAQPSTALVQPAVPARPDEGPVMVLIEYRIDPTQAEAFHAVMQETRRARLRQGALSWGLFRDIAVPGRYVEYYLDESWLEHLRRLERFTASDAGLRERRLAFHIDDKPPVIRRLIGESDH